MEDKPGASGDLDTDVVAKATPDGSTLGVSIGGPPAINSLLFARLPYDPRKDIAPIPQRPGSGERENEAALSFTSLMSVKEIPGARSRV